MISPQYVTARLRLRLFWLSAKLKNASRRGSCERAERSRARVERNGIGNGVPIQSFDGTAIANIQEHSSKMGSRSREPHATLTLVVFPSTGAVWRSVGAGWAAAVHRRCRDVLAVCEPPGDGEVGRA
jgi:hypothetical protein